METSSLTERQTTGVPLWRRLSAHCVLGSAYRTPARPTAVPGARTTPVRPHTSVTSMRHPPARYRTWRAISLRGRYRPGDASRTPSVAPTASFRLFSLRRRIVMPGASRHDEVTARGGNRLLRLNGGAASRCSHVVLGSRAVVSDRRENPGANHGIAASSPSSSPARARPRAGSASSGSCSFRRGGADWGGVGTSADTGLSSAKRRGGSADAMTPGNPSR